MDRRTAQAIHPALAPASLGLLAVGTALDMLAGGQPGALTWLAFWTIAIGVAGGAWCALFVLLDWVFFAERGDPGATGLDGLMTGAVVGLYALSASLRVACPSHAATAAAMAMEVAGAALLGTKAWIGRELASWLVR